MNKREIFDLFVRDKGNKYARSSLKQLSLSIEDFFKFITCEISKWVIQE